MKVLILAGGFATRLWPLTEKRAKPLLPLGGKPLISHLVDGLPVHMEILVSTNQVFAADFEEWKRTYPDRAITVFIEDSGTDGVKPGALAATALVIRTFELCEPLLLLAGDNYMGFELSRFLDAYAGRPLLAVYDTKSFHEAKKFGVVTVDGGRVKAFREKPADPVSTLVSTGCYLFPEDRLSDIVDYSKTHADNLGGIFEYFLTRGIEVDAFSFEEEWIDIGSFDSYLQAHRKLQTKNHIGRSLVERSRLGAGVYVDDECTIRDSVLENVIILSGTTIANARIKNAIVDKGCVIDGLDLENKMIRSGFRFRPE